MNGGLSEQDEAFLRVAQEQDLLTRDKAFMLQQEKPFYPDDPVSAMAVMKGYLDQTQVDTIQKMLEEQPGDSDAPPAEESPADPDVDTIAEDVAPAASVETAPPPPPEPAAPPPESAAPPPPSPAAPPEPSAPPATEAPPSPQAAAAPPRPAVQPARPARPARSREVNGVSVLGDESVRSFARLADYLGFARDNQVSDLHLSTGYPPYVRRHGRIQFLDRPPLEADEATELVLGGLTDEQRAYLEEHLNLESALDVEGQGRYRMTVVRQRLGWDGTYRVVSSRVPTVAELGLPGSVQRLADYRQGMILVTGPGGCGKTTTMAALVDYVNSSRAEHIVTLEQPIEYTYEPKKAHINQRQVGIHTASYHRALRAGLREDPDVILLGEMRDLETISMAITAAETGHLIFGTLHTTTAPRTISRILDSYPPHQQPQIRTMMAESLRGIICQQLVPRTDGTGVALAVEILVVTPGVSSLIREMKLHQIASIIQTGKRLGMVRMDDSLMNLFNQGVISIEEAHARADDKRPFAALLGK